MYVKIHNLREGQTANHVWKEIKRDLLPNVVRSLRLEDTCSREESAVIDQVQYGLRVDEHPVDHDDVVER